MSGEPIIDAWTRRAMERMPGATVEEIVEEVLRVGQYGGRPWPAYERRVTAERVREIVAEARRTPQVTLDEIKAKQAELAKAGLPSGQREVAKALSTSKTNVQRILAGEVTSER